MTMRTVGLCGKKNSSRQQTDISIADDTKRSKNKQTMKDRHGHFDICMTYEMAFDGTCGKEQERGNSRRCKQCFHIDHNLALIQTCACSYQEVKCSKIFDTFYEINTHPECYQSEKVLKRGIAFGNYK